MDSSWERESRDSYGYGWRSSRRRSCRLETQVGLWLLFNLSMSSARSYAGLESCSGIDGSGLSGRGPSQRSVRMLSSEGLGRRRPWISMGGERACGEVRSGFLAPVGSSSKAKRPPLCNRSCSRSSWKMGMAAVYPEALLSNHEAGEAAARLKSGSVSRPRFGARLVSELITEFHGSNDCSLFPWLSESGLGWWPARHISSTRKE